MIKNKAASYIRTAKIILALLSSGILALIFVMWRIWRNIVNMKKLFKNVASDEDRTELKNILSYPAFAGSHSRNAGTSYMNVLYAELGKVASNLQTEIERVGKE